VTWIITAEPQQLLDLQADEHPSVMSTSWRGTPKAPVLTAATYPTQSLRVPLRADPEDAAWTLMEDEAGSRLARLRLHDGDGKQVAAVCRRSRWPSGGRSAGRHDTGISSSPMRTLTCSMPRSTCQNSGRCSVTLPLAPPRGR
jgi:hypothetical protein